MGMKESKHTKAYLIAGLIFVTLFSHLPMVYTLFYHNLTGAGQGPDCHSEGLL